MHLPHNANPTHRVAYTCQSPFFHFNVTSFHFYLAYYLYTLSWDRVVSGLKIRPESTRITSYPNPTCINIFFNDKPDPRQTQLNYTRVRPNPLPDRIYFRTRLDPNVNGIDVCTACSSASARKNPGVLLTDLATAPLLSFSLFTY